MNSTRKTVQIILTIFLFSITGFSLCQCGLLGGRQKGYLAHVVDGEKGDGFDVSKYHLTILSGDFAAEPSTIYRFVRSIIDSWEVELTTLGCFPVRVEFCG